MKLIKLASLALAAVGTFGVYNAGAASIGTTTNSTPLNVAITAVTNIQSKTSGNTTTYATKTVKLTNKDLIALFARWSTVASNSFAVSGMKLVIGWDQPWNGDVLVVDKDGNVFFDASAGNDPFFEVVFDDEDGAYNEKYVNASPGSDTFTEFEGSYFELYDNNIVLPYTDVFGYGAGKVTYSQKWDKNGKYSGWKLSATGMFPLYGDQFINDSNQGSASAAFKTSGTGKTGFNNYWY